jgi:hypothetical protein
VSSALHNHRKDDEPPPGAHSNKPIVTAQQQQPSPQSGPTAAPRNHGANDERGGEAGDESAVGNGCNGAPLRDKDVHDIAVLQALIDRP